MNTSQWSKGKPLHQVRAFFFPEPSMKVLFVNLGLQYAGLKEEILKVFDELPTATMSLTRN